MSTWLRNTFRSLLCIATFVLLETGVAWGVSELVAVWYMNEHGFSAGEDLSNDLGLGILLGLAVLPALLVASPFSWCGSIKAARNILPEQ